MRFKEQKDNGLQESRNLLTVHSSRCAIKMLSTTKFRKDFAFSFQDFVCLWRSHVIVMLSLLSLCYGSLFYVPDSHYIIIVNITCLTTLQKIG